MESRIICQSCSMPIDDPDLQGTEKDGSRNQEYCRYCYQDGAFVNPDFTLDEMKSHIIEKMDQQKVPEDIIESAVLRLKQLKRWKNKMPQSSSGIQEAYKE